MRPGKYIVSGGESGIVESEKNFRKFFSQTPESRLCYFAVSDNDYAVTETETKTREKISRLMPVCKTALIFRSSYILAVW